MNLTDELAQKQALKFQLNDLNTGFINRTMSENKEGIFNLSWKLDDEFSREVILDYLKSGYENYEFEMSHKITNYEISFRRKD